MKHRTAVITVMAAGVLALETGQASALPSGSALTHPSSLASVPFSASTPVLAGGSVLSDASAPAPAGFSGLGSRRAPGVVGTDVSNWTGDIDWEAAAGAGAAFAFVHASEGVDYVSPRFAAQYGGAAEAGLLRGAYHFAQPHESGGAEQADFFVRNGGRWTSDGRTLPGVLDLEDNPYGKKNRLDNCYGLTPEQAVAWVGDFTRRYRQRTGKDAIIYTTTSWWRTCTGDSRAFGRNPLWLARWGTEPGELPAGWKRHTFWQSADRSGSLPGGQNSFNGTPSQLKTLTRAPSKIRLKGAARGNTYTVTVANTGTEPVTALKLAGRTFGGQKFTKAGRGCRFSGTAVRCTITRLGPKTTARLTFTVAPAGPGGPKRGLRIAAGPVTLTLPAAR
ncbi:GH25 family lysozyme [Planomonospora parontospora]|uniref:GH25 family lysozyme n=1 Tax=Planomonospora parontospora TaxID=58119 RepID=UPI00177A86EA|nr:GH25 family lysozyme [Planomonospora parontospora]